MAELAELLEAVPGESRAGLSLVDDPDVSLLRDDYERLISQTDGPVSGSAIDEWRDLALKAGDLLEKSKNLELAFYWACGRLVSDGVEGLADGLALIRQLCNQYWADLHPQPRPGDPVGRQRQNWLNDLANPRTYLRIVSEQELFSADSQHVSFRDIAIAAELRRAPEDATTRSAAELTAAFADVQSEPSSHELLRQLQTARNEVLGLTNDFKQLTNGQGSLQLEPLSRLLDAANRILAESAGTASSDNGTVNAAALSNGEPVTSTGGSGPPVGLESARQQLKQVIAFFEKTEPSSPVPLILRRAEQLIGKTFVDCLADLGGSMEAVKQVVESATRSEE